MDFPADRIALLQRLPVRRIITGEEELIARRSKIGHEELDMVSGQPGTPMLRPVGRHHDPSLLRATESGIPDIPACGTEIITSKLIEIVAPRPGGLHPRIDVLRKSLIEELRLAYRTANMIVWIDAP